MMHLLTSWCTLRHHDLILMLWAYILTLWHILMKSWSTLHIFFMSWHTFWRIFDIMMYFHTFWLYGVRFDIMTYPLTQAFDVITYFLLDDIRFEVTTYFPYFLPSWTYFLTPWRTFLCHDVLFDILTWWHTLWRHGVFSIFLTSWAIIILFWHTFHISWLHDLPF